MLRGTVDAVPMWLLLIAVVVAIVGVVLLLVPLVRFPVVVDEEWPRMQDGETSARAWAAVDDIYAALQAVEPSPARTEAFLDDAVRQLNDAVLIALVYPFSGDLAIRPEPFRTWSLARFFGP